MVCVWTKEADRYKCRLCVAGNFESIDPLAQHWTAQAEPGSLMIALKKGRIKRWVISKHDVKGAFLNASLGGKLVVVRPPPLFEKWGLVEPGELWTLDKAVYGLRESPRLWSAERDSKLRALRWERRRHLLPCPGLRGQPGLVPQVPRRRSRALCALACACKVAIACCCQRWCELRQYSRSWLKA